MNALASESFVIALDEADFAREVEQASTPVFVDFWSLTCKPCLALLPVFEALAEAYDGQIKFAKINASDNEELVQRLGVRGLPALLLFKGGQVVERVAGSRSRADLSDLLNKHVQRPVVATNDPANDSANSSSKSFRAFYGDASLRQAVVERVRGHVEAGRIVRAGEVLFSDAKMRRYSLMGAVLETADADRFEGTLGIPASVGRLQQVVHGLPMQLFVSVNAMQNAWPLEWWQAVPLGKDLQSLPSRFLHGFVRELAEDTKQYPVEFSEAACAALRSLAQLHARTAQGDAPGIDEWQAVRASLDGPLLKPRSGDADYQRLAAMIEGSVVKLASPADEVMEALSQSLYAIHFLSMHVSCPDGYTPEQWVEQQQIAAKLQVRADKAKQERFPGFADMTPAQKESLGKEIEALEDVQASMKFSAHFRPAWQGHWDKVGSSLAARLHAGLMQALNDTVASHAPRRS